MHEVEGKGRKGGGVGAGRAVNVPVPRAAQGTSCLPRGNLGVFVCAKHAHSSSLSNDHDEKKHGGSPGYNIVGASSTTNCCPGADDYTSSTTTVGSDNSDAL